MEKIRLGIIGMGNMGSGHFRNVAEGKCPSVNVTAVCDIDPKKIADESKYGSVNRFADYKEMLDSGVIDAALVAVPHYDHPTIAIECFKRGIHVLTEKPAGVYAKQVREMNEAAERSGVKFGIMFNQRTNPMYARAREIIRSGQLGQLKRMVWIVTNWYRTQAYYDSGSWRATWNGEGGGVLLNQAPHNLDLWQWIFGMPKRVRAFCTVGKYHNIGVEDDVTIYGEYENGATSVFISTTGEAPGTNRLEISGDLGKIVIEQGKLKWWKLKVSEREFCFASKEGFVSPETEYEEFTATEPEGHPQVLEAFAQSILNGTEMIADGIEGLNSLSISNAAYLSSWTDDWAEIPTDEALFEKYLIELCRKEKLESKPEHGESPENIGERWRVRW
ncbi:MAG: Gfo/Idh/MocA family oxidoreductase [Oscillospiraceae bacterium]|nr:Gfo/Idh/MocA family oxidoreductase [Oscillospiraceae bacterium]